MDLLKTSQLCSIEVFENILDDVVIVSTVKESIQDTLSFVECPSIQYKTTISFCSIFILNIVIITRNILQTLSLITILKILYLFEIFGEEKQHLRVKGENI